MSFLFPLYLLGALAIAIPVILHLRRRPTRDRIEFSSTLFLDPQEPPHRRSSRIEHWLLLALRCLALLFLALLFSRPLWRGAGGLVEMSGTTRLILLDCSASMRQAGAWEAAMKEVRKATSASADTRLGFGMFDSELTLVVPFGSGGEAAQLIESALTDLKPSWRKTALDEALIGATGWMEEETRGKSLRQEIVLISDFQEGASRERLQSFAWPSSIRLRVIPVVKTPRANATLQVVAAADEEDEEPGIQRAEAPRPETIRLRVTRSSNAEGPLTIRWKDAPAAGALSLQIPPGASRVLVAPPRPNPDSTQLELSGDAESFDNRAFIAPRRARTVRILFAGETTDEASPESPLFFLTRSVGPTATLRPEVTARRAEELAPSDWESADVVVINARMSDAAAAAAKTFVEAGGLVVVLPGDAASAGWLQSAGFSLTEAGVKDYALLEDIDFDHPVFRPFASPGLRDFSKIRTWHHRRISPPDAAATRILARFESGDPALIEWAIGRGRFLIWAMSWVPGDSQLPLSSKFVPMVYAILGEAGFRHEEPSRCTAGEELPGIKPNTVITLPDGTTTKPPFRTKEPGIYLLREEGEEARAVACNLPPEESRLAPFPGGALAALGVTVDSAAAGAGPAIAAGEMDRQRGPELEGQQKLWKWLLGALLAVLLAETWWANRPHSKRTPA